MRGFRAPHGTAQEEIAMARKGLPPILRAWKNCREELGVKPFKKMSPATKSRVRACVAKRMR